MTIYFAVDALQRPKGRFTSQKAAAAAAGEGGFVAYGAEDFLDHQTKAQMSQTRAYAAAMLQNPTASEDEIEDIGGGLYRNDPTFTNIKKTSAAELAELALAELTQAYAAQGKRQKAPKAEKPAKQAAKAEASETPAQRGRRPTATTGYRLVGDIGSRRGGFMATLMAVREKSDLEDIIAAAVQIANERGIKTPSRVDVMSDLRRAASLGIIEHD